MDLSSWLSLVAICCLGAMTPGPSLAVVLRQTLGNGRLHGIVAGVCHAGGVALWAVLSILGLGIMVTKTPALYMFLTYGGAAYLLWVGVKSLLTKGQSNINVEGVRSSLWDAAKDGALISLLNPKLAIFFIALFSQFVSAEMPGLNQLIIVSTVTIVDGAWYTLVAIALSHSSVLTKLNKKSAMINRVSGIVLIGLAVRVVTL